MYSDPAAPVGGRGGDASVCGWSRAALMVAHCAGMIDLVALPVWVGTLIGRHGYDAQQAGGLATLFLVGAVAGSLGLARGFHPRCARIAAVAGYGLAGLVFAVIACASGYAVMAALHLLAGACAACGLSATHGTIGRSASPHRLFAAAGLALGVFSILFLGVTPRLVERAGGPALFWTFAGVMLLASIVSALAFPRVQPEPERRAARFEVDASAVFGALGVAAMALVQAMVFSFLERMGMDRGFGAGAVTAVLIALGIVNLFPAPLAAVLEQRWPARAVLCWGPLVQASLALLIAQGTAFPPYAAGALFFSAAMIFTHTFAFGVLARLEPSGRLVAATPAMLMTGSAIGPFLGGTLVKSAGYGALGWAAVGIAGAAVLAFHLACRRLPSARTLART
ncbi:MFS transporter [Pigmentiphaga sp. GD03639]|uniref:MFS transporter n=1 Tax=Pigmentiphaga sp. GD03639 TaxID=2975354 RepID=UPI0024476253|nr:MFS transporter [Pigmentiphaga sp. GD03639]MDH2237846.1 MFS transporter [Pigmentiphaga sp. GD03639]